MSFLPRNSSSRAAGAVRLVRHISVAAVSGAIVISAAAYAFSPTIEAIGANVSTRVSTHKRSAIEGRILESKKGAKGAIVRITQHVKCAAKRHKTSAIARIKRSCGTRVIATRRVGANGRFSVRVNPGVYEVALQHGSKAKKRLRIAVKRGESIFIAATIEQRPGGLSIAPVIFNY